MFWTTVKYLGSFDRDLMYYLVTLCVIFFFVPYYFLTPFANFSWFGTSGDWVDMWGDAKSTGWFTDTLLWVGCFIVLVVVERCFSWLIYTFPENPLINVKYKANAKNKEQNVDL
jgi:hypothetical protein